MTLRSVVVIGSHFADEETGPKRESQLPLWTTPASLPEKNYPSISLCPSHKDVSLNSWSPILP